MLLKQIKIESPFKDLFDISPEVLSSIKENIEENGYDLSQPIIVWKGKNIIIDGHTRYLAASQTVLKDIPIFEKEFEDELQALTYAIHNQRDRRNITSAELIRCIKLVDKIKEKGAHFKEYPRDEKGHTTKTPLASQDAIGRSRDETAEIVGTSPRTVDRVRALAKDPEIEEKVIKGEVSIKKGAEEVIEKTKQESEKPTFNKTNDNIKWALWTWNPVTGCKHNCKYCYAKDIANRFYTHKFEPYFWEKRLDAPKNTKTPSKNEIGEHNVFVSSMGDLFGKWVPDEWINKVFEAINNSSEWWNYIFLTKNPKRYLDIKEFPKRCWIGATGDTQKRTDSALEVFKEIKKKGVKNKLFLSCEPLMERIDLGKKPPIDWLIIGGRSQSSGMEAGQPDTEWVRFLDYQTYQCNIKLYMKENLERIQEYPLTFGKE